jgi:uncharacterized protein (DUF2147 family)
VVRLGGEVLLKLVMVSIATVAFSAAACAAGVNGEWVRIDGVSKVRFSPCGTAICGMISWLKDSNAPAKVGQQVFFDMMPSGEDAWVGKAFNPEDGKTYTGKMTLSGGKLTTSGCVFGGLICKSYDWTRVR